MHVDMGVVGHHTDPLKLLGSWWSKQNISVEYSISIWTSQLAHCNEHLLEWAAVRHTVK